MWLKQLRGSTELRLHWRPLLAATLGLSVGASLLGYINSIFAPELISAFAWTRESFALTAMVGSMAVICIPIAGRLTDRFGVRSIATIGLIVFPLTFAGMSQMTGNIYEYVMFNAVQMTLCVTTTATVYSRVVAERFVVKRGIALAVLACGPALFAALLSPVLNWVIESYDWRTAYQALAVILGIGSLIVRTLLPKQDLGASKSTNAAQAKLMLSYAALIRQPTLWLILGAALLCSLPHALATSQLTLMLADSGISSTQAAYMVSIFAAGTMAGRILTGVALDLFRAHRVAVISMSIPSLGLFILGSDTSSVLLIGLAMMLLGFSMGAEGDVLAYLVIRHFGVTNVSTILGLVTATIALAGTASAIVLSIVLHETGSYSLFMYATGVCALLGAASFIPLRNAPVAPAMESISPINPSEHSGGSEPALLNNHSRKSIQ